MAGKRQRPIPAAVREVGERFEAWRGTRLKLGRIPEELWDAAIAVAREHGVWTVSRALCVNYDALKGRVGASAGSATEGEETSSTVVELPASSVEGTSSPVQTVVDLWGRDGERMTIRVAASAALDVAQVVSAFWERAR